MNAHRKGIARREAILRFVRKYQLANGYGPIAAEIKEGVGYRGGNIRKNYLDKMSTIMKDRETGRWVMVQVEHPRHIGLIHPTRSDRKYTPATIFAFVWARGISYLSAQLALMVDEGKDTAKLEAMLGDAREVKEWLELREE